MSTEHLMGVYNRAPLEVERGRGARLWATDGTEYLDCVAGISTNGLGHAKKYVKRNVSGGGLIYPSFHFNQICDETDVFVSLAKLKNHATCGVTLAMKNIFGKIGRAHV